MLTHITEFMLPMEDCFGEQKKLSIALKGWLGLTSVWSRQCSQHVDQERVLVLCNCLESACKSGLKISQAEDLISSVFNSQLTP